MGERRGAYRVLVGKTEGRRPLGKRNFVSQAEWLWYSIETSGGLL
jgi:hypothetical protein